MALVLAIEPDSKQASVLKWVVEQRLHCEFILTDSREAAVAALDDRIPDLVLVGALLSPRDEAEFSEHLRNLVGAEHLQTLTIPLLGSPHAQPEPPSRGGLLGGLLRRRKAPAPAGADPAAYADVVKRYLKLAVEGRTERAEHASRQNWERESESDSGAFEIARDVAVATHADGFDDVAAADRTEPERAFQVAAVELDTNAVQSEVVEEVADTATASEADDPIALRLADLLRSPAPERIIDELPVTTDTAVAPEPTTTEAEPERHKEREPISTAASSIPSEPLADLAPTVDEESTVRAEPIDHVEATADAETVVQPEPSAAIEHETLAETPPLDEIAVAPASHDESEVVDETAPAEVVHVAPVTGDAEPIVEHQAAQASVEADDAVVEQIAAPTPSEEPIAEPPASEVATIEAEDTAAEAESLSHTEQQPLVAQEESAPTVELVADAADRSEHSLDRVVEDLIRPFAASLAPVQSITIESVFDPTLDPIVSRESARQVEPEPKPAERPHVAAMEAWSPLPLWTEIGPPLASHISVAPKARSSVAATAEAVQSVVAAQDAGAAVDPAPDAVAIDSRWIASALNALRSDIQLLRSERPSAGEAAKPPANASSGNAARPEAIKPEKPAAARPKKERPQPVHDEWGFYDPTQAGFEAVFAAIDAKEAEEATAEDEPTAADMLLTKDLSPPAAASDQLIVTPARRSGGLRLAPLAMWARLERDAGSEGSESGPARRRDDLGELLAGLAIPVAVASVTYPTGCKIRRVRMTRDDQPRPPKSAEDPVIILSRRLLKKEREEHETVVRPGRR